MLGPTPSKVLIVEDDDTFFRMCARLLKRTGMEVHGVRSTKEAVQAVKESSFDVIVSDLTMPGGDGISLLTTLRSEGSKVPFVLMSGDPTTESAMEAVGLGAFRYLRKPFDPYVFLEVVAQAAKNGNVLNDRQANELLTKALRAMRMAYQPIVALGPKRHLASEALLRTTAEGVEGPAHVLALAERTERVIELGRRARGLVAEDFSRLPADIDVFVNLHPQELDDEQLYDPEAPLSRHSRRVVLEMTERAKLEPSGMLSERVERLRKLGYRIAVDDLGAGYAGLTSVAGLLPDIVKLDSSLVRGIEGSSTKRHIIASVVVLAKQLGAKVVAEAIETKSERDALAALGIEMMQGYFFGRPALEPTAPVFPD